MPVERTDGGFVVTGSSIKLFRLMSQRAAVGLELKGLTRAHGPIWKTLRDYYQIPGTGKRKASMQQVYDWLDKEVDRLKELEEGGP